MKSTFIIAALLVFIQKNAAFAQSDSVETLQWIENQAGKIDSLLLDAVQTHDQINIIFKLMDAYLIFEAVTFAGVYCAGVREAAQAGRNLTDVLNYRLEKDMNSSIVRTTQARLEAQKMKAAAQECKKVPSPLPDKAFSPADIIREDARMVELDISDGFASGDFHILSQKLEHSIRTLRDIERLASTLPNCSETMVTASKTVVQCEKALAARNWSEVKKAVEEALALSKRMADHTCN